MDGAPGGQARLRPRERLRRPAEFRAVFAKGRRSEGRSLTLIALPNAVGCSRLGLTVGRRVGSAVQRARVKRLLRECFRRHKPLPAQDLVLVAKAPIRGLSLAEVEREYRQRVAEIRRGGGRAPRRANPAAAD